MVTTISKQGDAPCPAAVVAIALKADRTHCGLFYTASDGHVWLCDFQNDAKLAKRRPLPDYYWHAVKLTDEEALHFVSLLEVVQEQYLNSLPYSFVFTSGAFDIAGNLRAGAGFTCATFIVSLFEAMRLPIVDVKTWKSRPKEDEAFRFAFLRANYYDNPIVRLSDAAAARIQSEKIDFRIKPDEVCAAAGVSKYPATFSQAVKGAERIAKTIAAREDPPLAVLQRQ